MSEQTPMTPLDGAADNRRSSRPDGSLPVVTPYATWSRVVLLWLNARRYRSIVHRHTDTFRACDVSARLYVEADTLVDLAKMLGSWPDCAEVFREANAPGERRPE